MTSKLEPEKMIGYVFGEYPFSFTEFNAILFALGSGFSQDPLNEQQLRFTYENHQEFTVFPSYSTQTVGKDLMGALGGCTVMPSDFNPLLLLHGEQRVQFIETQIKPNTEYITKLTIHDVIDKQKMYFLVLKAETYEKEPRKLAFINYFTLFIRQKGGAGFPGKNPLPALPKLPNVAPTKVVKISTVPNQALIFRLSGDTNPIHIDPQAAKMGKLEKPILHGLCSLSTSLKAIVMDVLKGEQSRIKAYQARFLGMVFPGDVFEIKTWTQNNGQSLIFETRVPDRNISVLMGKIQLGQKAKL